jgi:hypothetical protein
MDIKNFIDFAVDYGKTMNRNAPKLPVIHPHFGLLGHCDSKGFTVDHDHRRSIKAIIRDSDKRTIKLLRRFEDNVPIAITNALHKLINKEPFAAMFMCNAISNYDGIVTARGSGALQDVFMSMTATQTPVTLSWYDLMNFASWQPMTAPTITAYSNGATGGAVLNATSNGSWLTNPTGSNKKYIVSTGLSVTSITGFAMAMLYDCLWAGSYALTSNATINPTTDVAVTRYASTTAGNADYAGGNMMQITLYSTLTHTVAGTITTTYTNQGGTAGRTTISTMPATGLLTGRIIANTTHNTATVITSSPFMPMTNGGDSGVTTVEQVVISGGTVTVGTVYHKIVRPLVLMPFIAANTYIEQDATLNIGNMVELRNVSQTCGCLGWNTFSAGTTAASMSAFLRMIEG